MELEQSIDIQLEQVPLQVPSSGTELWKIAEKKNADSYQYTQKIEDDTELRCKELIDKGLSLVIMMGQNAAGKGEVLEGDAIVLRKTLAPILRKLGYRLDVITIPYSVVDDEAKVKGLIPQDADPSKRDLKESHIIAGDQKNIMVDVYNKASVPIQQSGVATVIYVEGSTPLAVPYDRKNPPPLESFRESGDKGLEEEGLGMVSLGAKNPYVLVGFQDLGMSAMVEAATNLKMRKQAFFYMFMRGANLDDNHKIYHDAAITRNSLGKETFNPQAFTGLDRFSITLKGKETEVTKLPKNFQEDIQKCLPKTMAPTSAIRLLETQLFQMKFALYRREDTHSIDTQYYFDFIASQLGLTYNPRFSVLTSGEYFPKRKTYNLDYYFKSEVARRCPEALAPLDIEALYNLDPCRKS